MDDPRLELIAAKIVERIARVRPENGYYEGITLTPERLKAITKPKPFAAIVYQDSIEDQPAMNAAQWSVRVAVAVPIIAAEADETPLDTYQNRVCACLHRAILSNESGEFDPQLDGLARRVDIKAPDLFAVLPGGISDGVTFYCEVQYSHALADATAAG